MMSAGSKRSRDAAEFDAHERERGRSTMPRLSGPPTSMPPPAFHAHGETPGFIMGPKATPAGPSPVAKEPATAAVTTDTARRILQTLDRLAGQKTSPETRGTAASPLPKPLNLSSSLNRAAAPTSALHGFRGIQRATPAKSFDDADKRSPAPSIASHSKSKMRAVPSAPRPSPLQFKPDVLSAKDTGTASASTAMEDNKTANAPVLSTYQSPFSDRAPLQRVHLRCLRLEHLIHRQRSLSPWNQGRKKKLFPHSLLENLVQWQLLRQRLTRLQRSIRSFHRTHLEAMNTMSCRSTICQYILSAMAMTGELML